MATLKETVADGLQILRAASAAQDVVRKQEFDAAIGALATSASVTAAIGAAAHDPVTVQSTTSLILGLSGQDIVGSTRVAPSQGILITAEGLGLDFGTGATQAAAGDHTHSTDHDAATGSSTQSASVTIDANQIVTVNVTLDPAGNLAVGAAGIGVPAGTFSTSAHTHSNASAVTAGFMSSADKSKLDTLTTAKTYTETATIEPVAGSSSVAHSVKLGFGLTTDANGVAADTAQLAVYAHTHPVVGSTSNGFMSVAQSEALAACTYVYRMYADDVIGSNVVNASATPSDAKLWQAIKISTTPITSPAAPDFAGLWQRRLSLQQVTVGSSNGTLTSTTELANALRAVLIALGIIPD